MKGFIEIVTKDNHRRLVNIQRIEEVCEVGEHHCNIYMASTNPTGGELFYHQVRKSYNEIVTLVKGATL